MQQTPLHGEYAVHGAKVVDFHGWALPVQFSGIIQEHQHARAKAGLFDCSHMGEFWIEGADRIAAFSALTYADMPGLKVGRCRYSALLNAGGGIIDDIVGLRLREDLLYVVTNAGPLLEVAALISEHCPGTRDLSMQTAKIDLQGPKARDILLQLEVMDIADMKYWSCKEMTWQGHDIVVTRAGYTGELGYEFYLPEAAAVPFWRLLAGHPDVAPCGLGARDTLRTEVGYPLNGEDMTPETTPLEAGMARFIQWDTPFPGKEALQAQRDAGDYRVLTAIRTHSRRAPRHGFEVKRDGDVVGIVTSGTFGPSVGTGVGLAMLDQAVAAPGTKLTAGPRDLEIETAEIPIYTEGTCRAKFA